MRNLKQFLYGATAIAALGFSAPGYAFTFNGGNFSVNAVGSGTSYTFTYTADFTSMTSASTWWNGYAAGVSLDFGNGQLNTAGSGFISTNAGGTEWDFFIDKLSASGAGCSSSTNDALCAVETSYDTTPLALTKLNGQTLNWVFDVEFANAAAVTAFFATTHNVKFFVTDGTIDNQGFWNKQDTLMSQPGTVTCCTRPPDEVPEPGTLALLGLGLLGLGMSRRRA